MRVFAGREAQLKESFRRLRLIGQSAATSDDEATHVDAQARAAEFGKGDSAAEGMWELDQGSDDVNIGIGDINSAGGAGLGAGIYRRCWIAEDRSGCVNRDVSAVAHGRGNDVAVLKDHKLGVDEQIPTVAD